MNETRIAEHSAGNAGKERKVVGIRKQVMIPFTSVVAWRRSATATIAATIAAAIAAKRDKGQHEQ